MKPGLKECGGMNCYNFPVETIFPVYQGHKRNDDPVVATGSVIIEVEECLSGHERYVVFQFFEEVKGLRFRLSADTCEEVKRHITTGCLL